MSTLPDRLRDLHERALTGGAVDYSLILKAANEIERFQRQIDNAAAWNRDNLPEMR